MIIFSIKISSIVIFNKYKCLCYAPDRSNHSPCYYFRVIFRRFSICTLEESTLYVNSIIFAIFFYEKFQRVGLIRLFVFVRYLQFSGQFECNYGLLMTNLKFFTI